MKKGVSLAALTATITIMIILISVVTISGSKMLNNTKITNFATEIKTIQQAVDTYLLKNPDEYPVSNSIILDLSNVSSENRLQFTDNGDVIVNDSISLFEIDYNKIGYTDLKYGNKKDGENDIYVLSGITGKVYYAKGFKVGSEIFYTLTSGLEKALEYKTTNSIVDSGNTVISYEQESIDSNQEKVKVKIPINYIVNSVKVGESNYSATTSDEYNIYEVTGLSGDVIEIIYTDEDNTKYTSYTIR